MALASMLAADMLCVGLMDSGSSDLELWWCSVVAVGGKNARLRDSVNQIIIQRKQRVQSIRKTILI